MVSDIASSPLNLPSSTSGLMQRRAPEPGCRARPGPSGCGAVALQNNPNQTHSIGCFKDLFFQQIFNTAAEERYSVGSETVGWVCPDHGRPRLRIENSWDSADQQPHSTQWNQRGSMGTVGTAGEKAPCQATGFDSLSTVPVPFQGPVQEALRLARRSFLCEDSTETSFHFLSTPIWPLQKYSARLKVGTSASGVSGTGRNRESSKTCIEPWW